MQSLHGGGSGMRGLGHSRLRRVSCLLGVIPRLAKASLWNPRASRRARSVEARAARKSMGRPFLRFVRRFPQCGQSARGRTETQSPHWEARMRTQYSLLDDMDVCVPLSAGRSLYESASEFDSLWGCFHFGGFH